MTRPDDQGPEERRGATVAQLRDDIDSGRTGDKIGGFDPAASPLGTDDEAAGVRHDPELVEAMRLQERSDQPTGRQNAATPEMQPDGRPPRPSYLAPALLGVAAAVVLAALLLALL